MRVHRNPKCKLLKLPRFVHPLVARKPGTLFRIDIKKIAPELFPNGCPESYFITTGAEGPSRRGAHGHPVGSKAEIFVVTKGSAHIHLHSTEGCGIVTLEEPDDALVIIPGVWHAVDLDPHSTLIVYASLTMEEGVEFTDLPCQCPMP